MTAYDDPLALFTESRVVHGIVQVNAQRPN